MIFQVMMPGPWPGKKTGKKPRKKGEGEEEDKG